MLTILQGDWIEKLKELPDESVQCCVTSPPYWGLRDYGVAGQLGMEKTPEEYVAKMVEGFREVMRVLRKDGTLWLNLGDGYSGGGRGGNPGNSPHVKQRSNGGRLSVRGVSRSPLKNKDLIGIPWLVAFALRADGWYLRCDVIWSKPNPMPESVIDRPTRAHEYLFLLSKSARYFYDAEAIKENATLRDDARPFGQRPNGNHHGQSGREYRQDKQCGHSRRHAGFNDRWDKMSKEEQTECGRNKRSVWTIATSPFKEAHFATFPPDLIKPCVLAGTRPGDTILDPFCGSGTTGQVSLEYGRKFLGIELNPAYIEMAARRCNITPGLRL